MKLTNIVMASVAIILMLTSCSSDQMEYIPYKSSSNGGWGLIDAKGKVKFEGEFENSITAANHGAFFAKTNDGKWILYSVKDKTPKAIGTPYSQAGAFIAEVAPVVKPGEKITLISPDGEVKVTLDKVDGNPIIACTNFLHNGLARIATSAGEGVINTSGDVIVKPAENIVNQLIDGYILSSDNEKKVLKFLNTDGKELGQISTEKYSFVADGDGVFGIKVESEDGSTRYGLMTPDGKWKLDPSAKIHSIKDISNGKFIYEDSDSRYGVMDFSGEVIIQPNYEYLRFVCGGKVYLAKQHDDEYFFMNEKEENIVGRKFEGGGSLLYFDDVLFGVLSDESFLMYNKKGKEIEAQTRITTVPGDNLGDELLRSEFVDTEAMVASLDITDSSMMGLNLNMKPEAAIKTMRANLPKLGEYPNLPNEKAEDYYSGDEEIYGDVDLSTYNCSLNVHLVYPASFRDYDIKYEEKVYSYGDYSYTSEVPVYKYYFKNISPESLQINITTYNEGVAQKVFNNLKSKIKSYGAETVVNQNDVTVKGNGGFWRLIFKKAEEERYNTISLILSKKADVESHDKEYARGDVVVEAVE
ncbi:MAG: hypothetical protein HDR98_08995 [Bacteroides sp.]|nr:hypothetical protein [Bacteroides sp.]